MESVVLSNCEAYSIGDLKKTGKEMMGDDVSSDGVRAVATRLGMSDVGTMMDTAAAVKIGSKMTEMLQEQKLKLEEALVALALQKKESN
jgi:hypothetical protein